VLELANFGKVLAGGTPSTLANIAKLSLGILLLGLAGRRWRSRPKAGEEPEMPKWMATIDKVTSGKAFGLAALLSGASPKNLALTIATTLAIVNIGLSGAMSWLVLIAFIVLASLTVAIPLLFYLFTRQSAQRVLNTWKAWG